MIDWVYNNILIPAKKSKGRRNITPEDIKEYDRTRRAEKREVREFQKTLKTPMLSNIVKEEDKRKKREERKKQEEKKKKQALRS